MNGDTKLKIYKYIDIGKYLRAFQNFYARGPLGSTGPPNVNLGPPNISENTRARKLKLKTPLDILTYSPKVQKIPLGGVQGGTDNVNLGSLKISETTRARMLKLKTELDIVKYSLWVKKFLR